MTRNQPPSRQAAAGSHGSLCEGRLVVFEGPDGVGKTTLVQQFAKACRATGEQVTEVAFPGREEGTLGHLVYQLHHNPEGFGVLGMTPLSLQVLHLAAHVDAIERLISPLVKRGETVVLDRFWWSTWVYGIEAGVDPEVLRELVACERGQWGELVPEIVVLVVRPEPFRLTDTGRIWQRQLRLYEDLAAREAANVQVTIISNSGSVDEAVAAVRDAVRSVREARTVRPWTVSGLTATRPNRRNVRE